MAKRKVDIKIQAHDKASRSFRSAGKSAGRFGKTMQGVGRRVMSVQGLLGGIGLVMTGRKAIAAFNEQEAAAAKLGQVLKATGEAAGYTKQQMLEMASSLQKVTTYGDEVIINAQAILATFKNIKGDIFSGAIESILDMSQTLGQDLRSSAVSLGKALNDPIRGITALSRVGITFTEQQKRQIKVLAESGEMMEAQKIILAELKSEFGGVARAARETFGGKTKALLNSIGDSFEVLGERIVRSMAGGKAGMEDLIEAIDTMNEFKKMQIESEQRRKRVGVEEPPEGWMKKTHDIAAAPGRWVHDKVITGLAGLYVDVAGVQEKGNRESAKYVEGIKAISEEFKKGAISRIEYSKRLAELAKLYGKRPYKHPKGQAPQEMAEKGVRADKVLNSFYRWQERQRKETGAFPKVSFEQWKKQELTLLPDAKEALRNVQRSLQDSLRNFGQTIERMNEDTRRFLIREHFGAALKDTETELIRQRAAAGDKESQLKLEQLRIEEELIASRRKMAEIIASEVATEQHKLLAKQKLSELEQAEAARVESVRKNIFDTDSPTGPRSIAAVESRFLTRAPGHYDPFKDLRKDNQRMIKNTERTAKATEATAAKPTGDGVKLTVVKF